MAGKLSYTLVPNWEKLPEGMRHLDCVGAGIDAADRVYVITRMDAMVIVYEQDGTFVTSWGKGVVTPRTHCIKSAPDGCIYTADDGDHTVCKFSPEGELLREWTHVQRPTGLAMDRDGLICVTELWWRKGQKSPRFGEITEDKPGRVSVLFAEGEVLARFGHEGDRTAPGNFIAPHGIGVDSKGDI